MPATLPYENDAPPSPTAAASPAAAPPATIPAAATTIPAAAPSQPMGPPAARGRAARANGGKTGKTEGKTPAKQATVMHDEEKVQGKAPLDDEGGTLEGGTLAYEAQADDTNHSPHAATLAYDVADTSASDAGNGASATLPYDIAPVGAAGKAVASKGAAGKEVARRRETPARGKGTQSKATAAIEAVEGTLQYTAHQGDGEEGDKGDGVQATLPYVSAPAAAHGKVASKVASKVDAGRCVAPKGRSKGAQKEQKDTVKEEVKEESETEEVPAVRARRRGKVTAPPKGTSTANAKTPVPVPEAATATFRKKKIAAIEEDGERADGMHGEGDDASLVPTTGTSAAAVGGKRARNAEVTNEAKEQAVVKEEHDTRSTHAIKQQVLSVFTYFCESERESSSTSPQHGCNMSSNSMRRTLIYVAHGPRMCATYIPHRCM